MRNTFNRSLAATAVAAISGTMLFTGSAPAAAYDAGPLKSVVNGTSPASTSGTNFDTVQATAPGPCDSAAERHVLKIVRVTATNAADQPAADVWVGDNLYSPSSVGLPGPLTVKSSNSWQGWANVYGQTLVPANYEFELRCQNVFGTVLYEQWSGGVTFSTPTAWTANALTSMTSTTTAVSASPSPAADNETVTLTASVSETGEGAPTGAVEFFNGTTSLGSAPVNTTGVATLFVGPFAAGTYTIKGTYSGDGSFTGSTGQTSLTVTATSVNKAPTAVDDSYGTGQDTALSVPAPGVVGNDSDLDGDPITVGSASTPANGTVMLSADGSFTYTPNAGFAGIDSFDYTASDGNGGSDIATVTVTVGAPAPFAAADLSLGITDTPDPVVPSGIVTYTVTVSNAGPDAAVGVEVVGRLSKGARLATMTSSVGACTVDEARAVGIRCDLGTFASGASATITIEVKAPRRTGTMTLGHATVSSETTDNNPANNSATESTTVQRPGPRGHLS